MKWLKEIDVVFSSFQYVTLIAGQLTALCVLLILQMVLTEEQLHDWGWRIPFFIGALLAIVVFRIRRGLLETQSFKMLKLKQTSLNQACLLYLNIIRKKRSQYCFNSWRDFSFLYLHDLSAKIFSEYFWIY